MTSPSYPFFSILSLFSLISSCAHVLCLQLLSTLHFYTVLDQAIRLPDGTSLLSFISDGAMFHNPSLLRDCGFVLFRPSAGGSHQQGLGAGHTQESLLDRAAANAQRLWLHASPLQKMSTRLCSNIVSGIMKNHNTHLAPGFTLNNLLPAPGNVAILWGMLGPGCLTPSTKCPSRSGTASPRVD